VSAGILWHGTLRKPVLRLQEYSGMKPFGGLLCVCRNTPAWNLMEACSVSAGILRHGTLWGPVLCLQEYSGMEP
jgi:hypothetical protein